MELPYCRVGRHHKIFQGRPSQLPTRIRQGAESSRWPGQTIKATDGFSAGTALKSHIRVVKTYRDSWTICGSGQRAQAQVQTKAGGLAAHGYLRICPLSTTSSAILITQTPRRYSSWTRGLATALWGLEYPARPRRSPRHSGARI